MRQYHFNDKVVNLSVVREYPEYAVLVDSGGAFYIDPSDGTDSVYRIEADESSVLSVAEKWMEGFNG